MAGHCCTRWQVTGSIGEADMTHVPGTGQNLATYETESESDESNELDLLQGLEAGFIT